MSIFERITKEIPLGKEMRTNVKKTPFRINLVDIERKVVYFAAGKELQRIPVGLKTPIYVPKRCFDGIPKFLKSKGWVRIGTRRDVAPQGTLQEYLDFVGWGQGSVGSDCKKSNTTEANYVASVLDRLKIVEVNPNKPSKLRLRQSSTEK